MTGPAYGELLRRYERAVDDVESGYELGLDDYLNDLDARQLLEERRGEASAEEAARIEAADRRLRATTQLRRRCLWGTASARRNGWTQEASWWYWSVPLDPGEDLAAELEA